MDKPTNIQLILNAHEAVQRWEQQTPGALYFTSDYAQVCLENFVNYCPDKRQWVLVRRSTPVAPYELRYTVNADTGFYVMAVVMENQVGMIRDAFGPNYADLAIPRPQKDV